MLNFKKTNVNAGEPVTAQAWNDIVNTLFEVQTILTAAAAVVRVQITNPNFDTAAGRVTASRDGAPPAEAIRPIPPSTEYTFPRLDAGAYQIRAEAPGFTAAVGTVTVGATGDVTPQPLQLALTPSATPMPNVLGQKLPAALTALQTIQPRVLDTVGKDLPLTGFDAAYNDAPVLTQWPDPGELAPTTGSLIIVATVIQPEPTVAVPDLSNMTFAQAQDALAKVGLMIKLSN